MGKRTEGNYQIDDGKEKFPMDESKEILAVHYSEWSMHVCALQT